MNPAAEWRGIIKQLQGQQFPLLSLFLEGEIYLLRSIIPFE